MSQKIIEFPATTDSDLVITFPRKALVVGLHFRYNTSATAGFRDLVIAYRLVSDNVFALCIEAFDGISDTETIPIYADIGFGENVTTFLTFDLIPLPSVEIPAGGSVRVFDHRDVDVNDTIDEIVLTYDDGLMEDDPNVPTAA